MLSKLENEQVSGQRCFALSPPLPPPACQKVVKIDEEGREQRGFLTVVPPCLKTAQ